MYLDTKSADFYKKRGSRTPSYRANITLLFPNHLPVFLLERPPQNPVSGTILQSL